MARPSLFLPVPGRRRCLPLALSVGLSACGAPEGVVELNWVFVDRRGEAIYPGDQFATQKFDSSCNLRGQVGDDLIKYDLQLELSICDTGCAAGDPLACQAPECQVLPPQRFPCDTARASNPSVPSADIPYEFTVRAIITREGMESCTILNPACLAVPGPRQRFVEPGLLTDLQVYQIVVDIDASAGPNSENATLDLEACGCG